MSGRKGLKHYGERIKEIIRQRYKEGESILSISRETEMSRYSIQS